MLIQDISQLCDYAQQLAAEINSRQAPRIITLSGELGAGKTTLASQLAAAFGIEEPVRSPTYEIVRSYPITQSSHTQLLHADLYRLDESPLTLAELYEYLSDPQTIAVLEWPECLPSPLPFSHLALHISFGDTPDQRHIHSQRIDE